MRNMKSDHFFFHALITLAIICLSISCFFRENSGEDFERYMLFCTVTGVAYLFAATFIAGSCTFFTFDNYWEEESPFNKVMLVPLIPAVILAFQATEIFADAVFVEMDFTVIAITVLGILVTLFIPSYKKFSLHFLFKVLIIIAYVMLYLMVDWFYFNIPLYYVWYAIGAIILPILSMLTLIYSYNVSRKYT